MAAEINQWLETGVYSSFFDDLVKMLLAHTRMTHFEVALRNIQYLFNSGLTFNVAYAKELRVGLLFFGFQLLSRLPKTDEIR